MALRLFGFTFGEKDENKERVKRKDQLPSFAPPEPADGSLTVESGGAYGTYVDLEGTAKNEVELISRYRELSIQPEAEAAIEDIVHEAIVHEDDRPPVSINLDKLEVSNNLKNAIKEAFDDVLLLLNFNDEGSEIFKRWYVDGRLYYHKIIDKKSPEDGIQELRYVDPRRIKKVREVEKERNDEGVEVVTNITEYYVYNPRGMHTVQTAIGEKIATDSITYIHSGITDAGKNIILSYLQKAIKPMNQLRMVEDAVVIYRISRAPERRIFYVDVGHLPKQRAEEYLHSIIKKFRNKLIYNPQTGEIQSDKRFHSMLEDFWLPRREGSRGTEVTTLPGGQGLGPMEEVEYFKEKLYKSLNVPISRIKSDTGFSLGRSAEISRDEVKFTKFVNTLRRKFISLFNDLLRTELLLKGVIVREDWEEIRQSIFYDWVKDSHFSELKNAEIWRERADLLSQLSAYVGEDGGGYFSKEWVKRNVLHLTDKEIKDIEKDLKKEKGEQNVHSPKFAADQEAELQKKDQSFQKGEAEKERTVRAKEAEANRKQAAKERERDRKTLAKERETEVKTQRREVKSKINKAKASKPKPKPAFARREEGHEGEKK